ncbi:MAG: hypothetical protein LUD02_12930 [Tannerellaceae bacterium]|nr:hypothetical protein [Tannerellaceae bacterium]MCD8264936.1 hypothetical protein [Tannerellaceae bacterium]
MLKNKAQADLDEWVEEGLLKSRGRGSGKRYFRIPRQHDEVNSTKSVTDAPEM